MVKAGIKMGKENDSNSKEVIRIALFTVVGISIKEAVEKVILKRDDVELVVVVTCPGPKSRRSDAYIEVIQALYDAELYNTDVLISNKKSKYSELMIMYDVDLIMSIGYPWLLPVDILSSKSRDKNPGSPRLGAVNFHNAPLPKYRGPNSWGWSIINGDREFGFCTHRMDGDFDTGSILQSWTVPDNDINKSFDEVLPAILNADCVGETIDKMIAEDPGTKQIGDHSYAPRFDNDYRWIDVSECTALEVHNRVRAFYGSRDIPLGALTKIDGKNINMKRTFYRDKEVVDNDFDVVVATPGSITSRSKDGLSVFVQCKDIELEVIDWAYCNEIDNKKTLVTCPAA